jgi:Tripartite ATP-independent periplasmic transporters, DctQ component.
VDDEIDFRAPQDPIGRLLYALALGAALLAGLAVLFLALLTAVNVPLKQLFGQPLPGEFELVDLGVATAVFAFLPLAQFARGYVIVDLVTQNASPRVKANLDAGAAVIFAICMAAVAWRMFLGGVDIADTGEQTQILQLKYWWTFAVAVPSLSLLAAVCLYTAWADLRKGAA